ncbi:MAG: PqqD family protein [Hyphomicrobiales bacterium]
MGGISGSDKYKTIDGVDLNEVPDGYVIYDNDANKVHYLNTTAAIVYQLLDGSQTVDTIAELVKQAFGVGEDVDVTASIENLLEANLICKVE